MTDPIMPDRQTIGAIRPSLRTSLAAIYRDLAESSYLLGQHDQAERCLTNASALEFGGVLRIEETPS